MVQQRSPSNRKRFPIIPILGIGVLVAILLSVGGFVFAASQETHDSFCASCHSQPESTFYQRSIEPQPVDLASFHATKNTACINCHSGQGLVGRMQAELLGARNALRWYTGTAIQPAVMTHTISDQNCLKCHQAVTGRGFTPQEHIVLPGIRGGEGRGEGEGRGNHWHSFMARWQAASPVAGSCVSCHAGHITGNPDSQGFMNAQTVQAMCDACHQVLRRGE